ncbi:uncharacterized protein LOC131652806 [Vicia villosa]|uniref:uncharacterized protein LOC131652806 n=1 Tax=Vicia villosa TaxID=3911 RepID=UPI00273B1AE2|nr:uncharacterized protein LOC131652806 [Vicia villosa]XP_058778749.1 uncharacterized protein LOC131652806 [Vicia villosa]XP_058778750.1 uncharacterized protein LOC131652806 [Vicia villosa]
MSMDPFSLGVIRPSPGSCDERGKRLKSDAEPKTEPEAESGSEPEPESESEIDSETEREFEKERDRVFGWQSIPLEDLEVSDLSSRYEDHPYPFSFGCPKFTYVNKAMRKQEEDGKKALADYRESSRNISPYDVTDVPSFGNICGNNFPRPVTIADDHRRPHFIHLSKLALAEYNHDNQAIKYEFEDVIKATRQFVPLITYYITFQAKPKDKGDGATTTFQARVWDRTPSLESPVVESCSIKT